MAEYEYKPIQTREEWNKIIKALEEIKPVPKETEIGFPMLKYLFEKLGEDGAIRVLSKLNCRILGGAVMFVWIRENMPKLIERKIKGEIL